MSPFAPGSPGVMAPSGRRHKHMAMRPGEELVMWTSRRLAGSARKLLVLGWAIAVPLFSQNQTDAVWHGLLRNSEGAPIAGAEVRLSGAAKALANTIADGSFT